MISLYPLILQPIFKERVWGGRGLEAYFGDRLPAGPIGEAWILGEHEQGTNVVTNGPLAGLSLAELRQQYGDLLSGTQPAWAAGVGERFPLLVKLLDAHDNLSVQVHPDDGDPHLPPGEPGKTEMWYVLAADPGASIVYGLADEIDAARFEAAVRAGETMSCLFEVPVAPGDVYFVPAGTVHALCRGVMVAEVQQSSDTVYRLYDYDRPGLDGRPRELHIDRALQVTNYGPRPDLVRPGVCESGRWQTLVECRHFVVELGNCMGPWETSSDPDHFEALLVLEGRGIIGWEGGQEIIKRGQMVLIPAAVSEYRLTGNMSLLRSRLP